MTTRLHEAAAENPPAWWGEQARELLDWHVPFTQTLDESAAPFYRWFADGELNASYNCLDRHVEAGRGDRVAYHWRGEEGEERDVTYAALLADVQRLANVLLDYGVGQGDVVGIYLPMIPEAAVAMLACARIGAVHNVVFGGFSAASVAERMDASGARVMITVDGARRKGGAAPVKAALDEVLPDVPCIVVRHTWTACPMKQTDTFFDEALAAMPADCPAVGLPAEHPLFFLYSSGSTARPKGIVHTTGGYLTQVAWTHRNVFDLKPDSDVWFCTADVGWITGHSYLVYGPLLNGATSVMYEGAPDYPHRGIWWELCERYGVTVFYTAPTAIRACMKWGDEHVARHDVSALRLLGTVGEPINPEAWTWYHEVVGGERCPIVDTWWQTETGAILITTLPGVQPARPGAAGTPLPGIDADVLDETTGEPCEPGRQGLLALTRPWPAMLRTLLGDDDRYRSTYWGLLPRPTMEHTYVAGDAARRTDDGYVWVIGRIDDVVNVSGHRLSTAEVESALGAHPEVAEAGVIGESDPDTGQAITAFVTLRGELSGTPEREMELRDHVATRIGKLARPKRIVWAEDLPKTRSGKIMRRLLRDLAEGREPGDTSTLRDPTVIDSLATTIARRGS
jgi:acetyl-CoA synthetase